MEKGERQRESESEVKEQWGEKETEKQRERERDKETKRENFHSLVHFQMLTCLQQLGWIKSNPGDQNSFQISQVTGIQACGSSPAPSWVLWQKAGLKV